MFIGSLAGCIGTDIIDDFVEPRIALVNPIDAIIVGDRYSFEAAYFDNTGVKQPATFQWNSSNQNILEIGTDGMAQAKAPGSVMIDYAANEIIETFAVTVYDPETVDADSLRMAQGVPDVRTATLMTVSSYQLEGTAILRDDEGLKLELGSDFFTTDALPGLYLYLTNNVSSINNALELGPVEQFSGAQVYTIAGDTQINDFSHVLFYCKPFRVSVGTGEFMP